MSYPNMILYGAVIPSYSGGKEKINGAQDVIKADDPKNRDKVRRFFDMVD